MGRAEQESGGESVCNAVNIFYPQTSLPGLVLNQCTSLVKVKPSFAVNGMTRNKYIRANPIYPSTGAVALWRVTRWLRSLGLLA